MLPIQVNFPMPAATRSAAYDWPLDQMNIGDSFVVPSSLKLRRQQVSGAIQGWRMATGCEARFKTAEMAHGIGVWRTA